MKRFMIAGVFAGLFMLGACSVATVSNDLSVVQAEAKTITTAVNELAPALIAELPASMQAKAQTALTALDTAEGILAGTTAGTTAKSDVVAFLSAAQQVVGALPLPPATSAAVQVGLGLAEAFVSGLPVTVPASAEFAASPHVVAGPVPIPLQ